MIATLTLNPALDITTSTPAGSAWGQAAVLEVAL
ncbi:hypothetical protein SMNI109538_04395 [Smaragdicoccus niigatensis]